MRLDHSILYDEELPDPITIKFLRKGNWYEAHKVSADQNYIVKYLVCVIDENNVVVFSDGKLEVHASFKDFKNTTPFDEMFYYPVRVEINSFA